MKKVIRFKINEDTEIPQDCIDSIPTSGAADEAIRELRRQYDVEVDARELKSHLKIYGAWDESELGDHDSNIDRLLWIACLDCAENNTNTWYMGE